MMLLRRVWCFFLIIAAAGFMTSGCKHQATESPIVDHIFPLELGDTVTAGVGTFGPTASQIKLYSDHTNETITISAGSFSASQTVIVTSQQVKSHRLGNYFNP